MRAISVSVLTVAVLSSFSPNAQAACTSTFQCPNAAGSVDITLASFDGSAGAAADGVLNGGEVQCAIDCLNGTTATESDPNANGYVRGGEIRFDAGAKYTIDQTLLLPKVIGTLRVLGRGATLYLATPPFVDPVIFRRAVPTDWDSKQAEIYSGFGNGWVIEGFTFDVQNYLDYGVDTKALELHAMNDLVVRNNQFFRLGRPIEMRFVQNAHIQQNEFVNYFETAVYLGDRTGCRFGDCWKDSSSLVVSGCLAPRLSGNRYWGYGTPATAVTVNNADNVLILADMYEGGRPNQVLAFHGWSSSDHAVRDCRFEFYAAPGTGDSIIASDAPGTLVVERPTLVTPHAETLIDLTNPVTTETATVRLSDMNWLPTTVRFNNGSNQWRNRWIFENVYDNGLVLTSNSRWVGGPAPLTLVVDDAVRDAQRVVNLQTLAGFPSGTGAVSDINVTSQLRVDAPVLLNQNVRLPLVQPSPLVSGQVWFSNGRVMYCCDPVNVPRILMPQ